MVCSLVTVVEAPSETPEVLRTYRTVTPAHLVKISIKRHSGKLRRSGTKRQVEGPTHAEQEWQLTWPCWLRKVQGNEAGKQAWLDSGAAWDGHRDTWEQSCWLRPKACILFPTVGIQMQVRSLKTGYEGNSPVHISAIFHIASVVGQQRRTSAPALDGRMDLCPVRSHALSDIGSCLCEGSKGKL